MEYKVITDATCDMNPDILARYGIDVIPMEVAFDDERTFMHYPDYRNCSAQAFYDELRKGNLSHSTQITPQQYLDFFRPYLEAKEQILYICFSSALSNTYQSAVLARQELIETYPEAEIMIIDSTCASGGEGVMAIQAVINRDEKNMSLKENAQWLLDNRSKLTHYFTVGDLMYLHKGGRVGATTAIVGSALNIKPVLYVNDEGKLEMLTTAHGRKASLKKLVSLSKKTIIHPEEQIIYLSHADCEEEALKLADLLKENIPCKDVVITRVGPVVGTHTGPTCLCVFFWGTGRKADS